MQVVCGQGECVGQVPWQQTQGALPKDDVIAGFRAGWKQPLADHEGF